MRRSDDIPLDPDVVASLDAIDAALAGEPVDPVHAEVAELALLVAADRPRMGEPAAHALNARVQGRSGARRRPRRWRIATSALAGCTALVAVVAVLVVSSGGTPQRSLTSSSSAGVTTSAATGAARSAAPGSAAAVPMPQPSGGTRQIIQSAQLQLSAAPDQIDQVAQEAFDVVSAAHGFVASSTVTQTSRSDGYASLQLSVPSGSLSQAMNELARLPHAQVTSSTENAQDVTDQYAADQRRLSDAQALRTSLLKQLAHAQTPQQTASLNAQLHDADSAIGAAQAALATLSRQINFTPITLTISATAPAPARGFTIGKAAHDAARVLVVAAGVALIGLAVLVPIGLLGGLAGWAGATVRRRRREQALDTA